MSRQNALRHFLEGTAAGNPAFAFWVAFWISGGGRVPDRLPSVVPLLLPLAVVLIAVVLAVALAPIGLVQRYRAGTARRPVRGWLAALNVAGLLLSLLLFLGGAAVTSFWVPKALSYSVAGLLAGALLGLLGLVLTRWEASSGRVHYTPNRFLVLLITLIVTARLIYGFWRLSKSWQGGAEDRAWLLDSGIPGSMAAGALVLGYSFAYWLGLAHRARRGR